LSSGGDSGGPWELAGSARAASSIARSGERQGLQAQVLAEAIGEQVEKWQQAGDWQKIACLELLLVVGKTNQQVSEQLGLSEQQVANFKYDFLERLRKAVRAQRLDVEVFPELHSNQP
jgi:RNA polymerase sigma-70 factor (ECF subfamily)